MQFIGYDIGSSSVKGAILDGETGQALASGQFPREELTIHAPRPGWAEQSPETWWDCIKQVTAQLLAAPGVQAEAIGAIGISYQMHGLVLVDKAQKALRPSIIWCDSRAVEIGDAAFARLGEEQALRHLLNSPGNFTASKLKWVQENEPRHYEQASAMMLPGDYIAMRLTGDIRTTASGLSEGILWDFQQNDVADMVLNDYKLRPDLIPEQVPTFGGQGQLLASVAAELGLAAGIPVSYRAGDQPNNALSLGVLEPGEIAATGGTSGVVYGVSDVVTYDPQSRVNSFVHVNHGAQTRLGVLLCINGTGILNSWLRQHVAQPLGYAEMNEKASEVAAGSDGVRVYPFGNGAERVLGNMDPGARIEGLRFTRHDQRHLLRAGQEGIVASFKYGMDIMQQMGISPKVIRAGRANMFLSPLFRDTFATMLDTPVELYETDGAMGAARGAAYGAGYYASLKETFASLQLLQTIEPSPSLTAPLTEMYQDWKKGLDQMLASQ